MINKTAIKYIVSTLLFSLSFILPVNAQAPAQVGSYDVIVNANINVDLYTQLFLTPSVVEIKQPTRVDIYSLDSFGNPRVGRNIQLYIDGDSSTVSIVQPSPTNYLGQSFGYVSSTNPGIYTICAKDLTEGYEISIPDCEQVYVVPVPTPSMLAEPLYTGGLNNLLIWSMSGSNTYQYLVQAGLGQEFQNIEKESPWINNLTYEFRNLRDGIMYFYRVKAKNSYGGESNWSNIVFSVQDSSGPTVEIVSISGIGQNNMSEWDPEFSINIRYRIKDNVGISQKDFWCSGKDGTKYECLFSQSSTGDFWNISLKLKDLEIYNGEYLFDIYKFCVEAKDLVGNVNRNCDAQITFPQKEDEPPIIIPEEPIIPSKPTVIDSIRKQITEIIDNTIGKLEPIELQNIVITATTANIAVGLGFLLSLLGNVPYFILQSILAMLSLLGFRKKANVNGYVYDSFSKNPITQAIIRIYNENNELVWTDVTDNNGYFRTTEVEDAEYYIKVTARNYIFPSKIIFGKTDFPLENIYHGDPFLTRQNKVPNFSIPLDQKDNKLIGVIVARFISSSKALWKSLHIILFVFGLIFSIYALYVTSFWWNYLIIALYIPALIALLFSLFGVKEKYGLVKDKQNRVVKGAIVALKEKQFDKIVSKRVTDDFGRYRFVANEGKYSISILNPDIKTVNKKIFSNISVNKKGGVVICPDIEVIVLESKKKKEEDVLRPPKDL